MSDMKTALHEVVESVGEGDAVTLVVIGKDGANSLSNASATGIQGTIDVLITRLGFDLAESHGKDKPAFEGEAYCLGAKAVAQSAAEKAEKLRADRKTGPTHVVEDVTDGAGASDAGQKQTH